MLAGVGGATIVAACAPAVPSAAPTSVSVTTPGGGPAASTGAAKPASSAPRSGGTLRVAISADPASLDGHLYAAGRFDTMWLIYDRLIEYDVELRPQPMLAESWDVTIILNSEQPRPLVFDFFERLNMLDKNVMEGPDAKTRANGTGPFKFVEWIQGDHFATEKNSNFWMSGRPYLDGVRTLILKDQQGAVAQLEAGAVDVTHRHLSRWSGTPARRRMTPRVSTITHSTLTKRSRCSSSPVSAISAWTWCSSLRPKARPWSRSIRRTWRRSASR